MGIITKRNGKILLMLGVLLIITGFFEVMIFTSMFGLRPTQLGEEYEEWYRAIPAEYHALDIISILFIILIGPMLAMIGIPMFIVASRRARSPSFLMGILKSSVDMRTKISFLAQQLGKNEKDVINTISRLRSNGEPVSIDYSTLEVIYNPTLLPSPTKVEKPSMTSYEKLFSGILVEKWRRKSGGKRAGMLAVANEAERLALGMHASAGWGGNVEIMDFEGNVLRKFKTKGFEQIEITSDASKVYLLTSVGGKIFAYNSEGKKLKKYKYGGRQLSISEDGSMVTAGDALMDAEGNVIRFSDGWHTVIDAYSGKPEQMPFAIFGIFGIAPNGTYVVVRETARTRPRSYFRGTSAVTEAVTYQLNSIYIRPQDTNSLLGWKCVPFDLRNTGMEPKSWYKVQPKVYAHNSFFACARKSIGYVGLDGNLKWEFTLPHRDEIKQYYATPDAKYVFFTLKGRKKGKSIFILDAENRKVHATQLDIKKNIATFKATNDGRKLFVHTFSSWSWPPPGRVIAFDVK